jgi:hypothetical protein
VGLSEDLARRLLYLHGADGWFRANWPRGIARQVAHLYYSFLQPG